MGGRDTKVNGPAGDQIGDVHVWRYSTVCFHVYTCIIRGSCNRSTAQYPPVE